MDDDVPLSFRMGKKDNDREINEWYNEVKLGRQIRICKMQEVQVNMDDKSTSIIPSDEVHILVTEEDKTGEDILAMSDFFGGYVQQLIDAIRTNAVTFHREPHNCYLTLTVFLRIFARS